MINKSDKIYVARHRRMVGSAMMRNLQMNGLEDVMIRTSPQLEISSDIGWPDLGSWASLHGVSQRDAYENDLIVLILIYHLLLIALFNYQMANVQ